jgi:hypothetical protein
MTKAANLSALGSNVTTVGNISSASTLTLQTNSTTALTIDTSQNVGIGTTSPAQKLQVSDGGDAGDVRIQLGNTRKLELIRNSTSDNWIRSSSTGADFLIDQNANANLIMRTNATERMRIYSTGGVSIGNTTDPGATNLSVTGTVTSGGKTLGLTTFSSVSASGTSVDFSSIPSWVKRISLIFSGISTTGTVPLLVQLGDSGGVQATGYSSFGARLGASGVASAASTVGFNIQQNDATSAWSGIFTIMNVSGNTWSASWALGAGSSVDGGTGGGNKTLDNGVLTTVRITTTTGTPTFDAGTFTVVIE